MMLTMTTVEGSERFWRRWVGGVEACRVWRMQGGGAMIVACVRSRDGGCPETG